MGLQLALGVKSYETIMSQLDGKYMVLVYLIIKGFRFRVRWPLGKPQANKNALNQPKNTTKKNYAYNLSKS